MFSTSTQKNEWTFTEEQIAEKRQQVNSIYREKYREYVHAEEEALFLSPDEELLLVHFIEKAAVKFSETFEPPMWPTVRWTAYTYFKRLFLGWSVMDYSPKIVMMACFYLAMKIDEFYVSVDEFVYNLSMGTAEQNTARILGLEPEVIRALNYQLTVHCPFRPFEGHLLEMKTRMLLLNFDLEMLRRPAEKFFEMCLLCDVMLMYSPSQIAMAAIKYGLGWLDKSADVLRDFAMKIIAGEDTVRHDQFEIVEAADKLMLRLDEIIQCVLSNKPEISSEQQTNLQKRSEACAGLHSTLEKRRQMRTGEKKKEDPVDSDDE
ncbi:unnamed protein product [Auanema sp. JU1783]|nr:unnamed protein product [Auanema sp. JU1783]